MSNYDITTGFVTVAPHISRRTWDDACNDHTPVTDAAAIVSYIQQIGFMDIPSYLSEFVQLSSPWEYFEPSDPPELIRAAANGFSTQIMTPVRSSITPVTTASAPATSSSVTASLSSATMASHLLGPNPYAGLSPDQVQALRIMEKQLTDVNGQDAYSVTAMALGTLRKSEYLLLPDDMRNVSWPNDASAVGAPWDSHTSVVKFSDFVQIYALNKAAGKESKDPVFFGLLRAEAVKMGWYQGQNEVQFVPRLPDAVTTYIEDRQAIGELLEAARSAAFLIPFMAEYVFRTTGHHYLTGLADEYERKYMSMCGACLVPELVKYLRASELWHWSMHWVSPRVARAALVALDGTPRLPHAINLRANAAPAGTAIVTTTSAVILALESCNWADEVAKEGKFNFKLIKDVTAIIKAHVTNYHAAYFAYGVSPPSTADKKLLADAVAEAQKFAPIAQGFIDAMYADSSLAKAKALKKHAEASPVLQRRALRVFRSLAKADTEEISDIFRSSANDKKRAAKPSTPAATGAP